jgi:hypothetical protein
VEEYAASGLLEIDHKTGTVSDGPAERIKWYGDVLGSNELKRNGSVRWLGATTTATIRSCDEVHTPARQSHDRRGVRRSVERRRGLRVMILRLRAETQTIQLEGPIFPTPGLATISSRTCGSTKPCRQRCDSTAMETARSYMY